MKVCFTQPRKLCLPINIFIFNLCRLNPFRNKKLWVFGGIEGKKFDDNSRYMFEYVVKNHSDKIHAIWLTRHKDIACEIRALGYEAYTFYCLRGIKAALSAGVAFYSHALIDFGLFPLVGGATIVSLWHGVGFKQIYNAKYNGISLVIKKIVDKLFCWTYRNISTVTSQYTSIQFQRLFNIKSQDVFITGQPRNDILRKNINKNEVLPDVDFSKKWILYMPTYRGITLGNDAMERIIKNMCEDKVLDKALRDNRSILIVKLHPLTPNVSVQNRDNFIILDYSTVRNNQELLTVSDMMITDYSSCFVDFALLERPIIFYTPDEQIFLEKSEKLDDDFFRISAINKAMTPVELAEKISAPSVGVCKTTNDLFEDSSIKGTCYCENVYNVIKERIGL